MPKPYSLDLRERVFRYVNEGHSCRAAAAHFRVSVSFVVLSNEGKPRAQAQWRVPPCQLEPHRAFLLEKVAEKADITMPELAAELAAATCQKAYPASLSRWLIRIFAELRSSAAAISAASIGQWTTSEMPVPTNASASISSADAVARRTGSGGARRCSAAANASADGAT